jgi:hypothetical protein
MRNRDIVAIPAICGMYVRVNSSGKEGEQHHREAREGSGVGEKGRGGKHYPNRVGGRRG